MDTKKALRFLSDLKFNNNRDWFNENKALFNQIKGEFEVFIDLLIPEISKIDRDIVSVAAKDCVFRIYRDTRFSKDKTPHKTHFGAYIARGGRKSETAGFYVHIEPGNSFVGGGIYHPQSPILKKIREEVYHNLDEFLGIIQKESFIKVFPEIYGERLKTAPKGFPKDFEGIEWLRLKSYAVVHMIPDEVVLSDKFFDYILEKFNVQYPLNRFLNLAIE